MFTKTLQSNTRQSSSLPLVVAVTGHRDLVETETDKIRDIARNFFLDLQQRYPTCRLTVMSPLAEGADTLIAEVAIELSLDLIVPLPKSRELYLADFRSNEAREHFNRLSEQALEVLELPNDIPEPPQGISQEQWAADFPYAQLGIYLSAHCHILMAVWDGNSSRHLGGTAQVVKFHHDDVMPGITSSITVNQQNLVDDESDLVFHIVCSRSISGHTSHPQYPPVDWFWYTKDIEKPRAKELPQQHELIFRRISEFYQDATQYSDQIEREKISLLSNTGSSSLPQGINKIDHLYVIADWLAIHFQRLTLRSLGIMHLMALLMGLMFILYSDFASRQFFLVSFVVFFIIAWVVQALSRKGEWHRKYLDYRTLAEGLRIQLYWAAAGVRNENKWRFSHDSYLQSQHPEFGWIRNIMRLAGSTCDAMNYDHADGMAFSLQEWIGNSEEGQLGYFMKKARDRTQRHSLTRKLGLLSLATSVLIVFVFLFFAEAIPEETNIYLKVVMGTMLMLFAVREGYAYATAEKELIKQYEYMLGIYENAARRLAHAKDQDEKQQILRALGQSALNEHSNWILMHRERSPDQGEIWRMSS